MTPAQVQEMMVDVAVAETRKLLEEDHNPNMDQILADVERKTRRTARTSTGQDAVAYLVSLPDAEAVSWWTEQVSMSIRKGVADLRPS